MLGLGFRVWGLGFGVLGSELGVGGFLKGGQLKVWGLSFVFFATIYDFGLSFRAGFGG